MQSYLRDFHAVDLEVAIWVRLLSIDDLLDRHRPQRVFAVFRAAWCILPLGTGRETTAACSALCSIRGCGILSLVVRIVCKRQ